MATILLVDDVRDYCEELGLALERDGHYVRYETTARGAIDAGMRFRPDLLVTDWMLEDYIHGLSVSETLRVVHPSLRTILMTGYASHDLRAEAETGGIAAFLEKPFPLVNIRESVSRALAQPLPPPPSYLIGFLEVSDGSINYLNPAARSMFDYLGVRVPGRLDELLDEEYADEIGRSLEAWVAVGPPGWHRPPWQLRGRVFEDGTRIFVLLRSEESPYLMGSPVVSRLLDLPDPFAGGFAYKGHVLVVDDLESIRHVTAEVIRQTGGICLSASNHTEAMHLFAHDGQIAYVLIDYEMPDGPPVGLVERIRALRPHVHIIGSSGAGRQQDFARLGVNTYLAKPWHMSDLLTTLAEIPGLPDRAADAMDAQR